MFRQEKMVYSTSYPSPLGDVTLAAEEHGLIGLWLANQKYFSGTVTENMVENRDFPILQAAKKWLDDYFDGKKPSVSGLPLAPRGTGFRQLVWDILRRIPYGKIITYGEIARQVAILTGKPHMSSQAVGGAVGHNPISIIIPCHRVVGSDGNLTGYAGGLSLKIALLEHEKVDMSRLFISAKETLLPIRSPKRQIRHTDNGLIHRNIPSETENGKR